MFILYDLIGFGFRRFDIVDLFTKFIRGRVVDSTVIKLLVDLKCCSSYKL